MTPEARCAQDGEPTLLVGSAFELRGALLGGRYRLISELARGGCGVVWRAADTRLKRPVAVKLPLEREERFHREALNLARLRHPSIVAIHDAGTELELDYLVMELLSGRTLAEHLEREVDHEDLETRCRYAGEIGLALARALQYVHHNDLLHLDLKPHNIFLDESTAVPKIIDWGLTRPVGDRFSRVAGTYGYAAPEQIVLGSMEPGPWTDLFGLGAILYRITARKKPYAEVLGPDGSDAGAWLRALRAGAPSLPSAAPEPLVQVLEALLRYETSARPRDAGPVARRLEELLDRSGWDSTVRVPEPLPRVQRAR